MREALAEIIDEGVESFRERHVDNAQRLYEGLMNIGLEPFVEKAQERLPTITSVRIPHGLNFTKIQNYLMERYVHGLQKLKLFFSVLNLLNYVFIPDIRWKFQRDLVAQRG